MIMKKKWIETHSSESAYEHSSLYSVLHSWFKLKKKKTYADDYDHNNDHDHDHDPFWHPKV